MKSVKYDVTYAEGASRLEVIIRFFWMIPSAIVLIVLGIIGYIAYVLQWLHMLILGKRNKMLHDWIYKLMAYSVKVNTYYMLLTDERNPIMPED